MQGKSFNKKTWLPGHNSVSEMFIQLEVGQKRNWLGVIKIDFFRDFLSAWVKKKSDCNLALLQIFQNSSLASNGSTMGTVSSSPVLQAVPPVCPPFRDNLYEPVYSCYMPHEAAVLGLLSLLLTLINIACIFIMGIIVLRVSECVSSFSWVHPMPSRLDPQ